jgi:hypothetical protein
MSKLNYAGEYAISELKLMSSSGNVVDLSMAYTALSLFEDIFSSSMSGLVVVTDTNNILMNLPVTGQDYLSMKIVTPSLEKSPIDYTQTVFAVNKIDTRVDADGTQVFQLHFISPELLRNERVRISKSYESTISNMVYDALNNAKYINTNKEIFLEETKGIRKIVVPNSHPFDFIKKLAREAESKEYNSPHYLFYENIFGIHFRSIESLYRQASIGSYHAGDVGFSLTTAGKIEEEYARVIDYQIQANNDTLANVVGGMLASKIITHDIVQKKYDISRHDYFQDFYKYKRVNYNSTSKDNPIYSEVPLDTFGNNLGNFDESRIHLHPTSTVSTIGLGSLGLIPEFVGKDASHYTSDNESLYESNAIPRTLLSRQAKFMELNAGTSINMQIKGNTTIACGDIVEFDMPIVGKSHGKGDSDIYYSGRYLISKLRHIFQPSSNNHEIALTLVKDSFSTELPINKKATEPKGDKGMLHTKFF